MFSLEEFKKLISTNREYSEEEIIKIKENMESTAEIYFNMWLEDKKKNRKNGK